MSSIFDGISKPIGFDFLIVIDGTDGSGKATQSKMLYDWLVRNRAAYQKAHCKGQCWDASDILYLDFPDYQSQTGKLVKHMLDGHYGEAKVLNPYFTSPMYALDRFALMRNMLVENGRMNTHIGVANRYTISNIIHQGARLKNSTDFIKYWAWEEDFEFNKLGLPKPNCVIHLNVPCNVAHRNVEKRAKETGAQIDINETAEYMALVDANLDRIRPTGALHSIACTDDKGEMRPIEDIQKDIREWVTFAIKDHVARYEGQYEELLKFLPNANTVIDK